MGGEGGDGARSLGYFLWVRRNKGVPWIKQGVDDVRNGGNQKRESYGQLLIYLIMRNDHFLWPLRTLGFKSVSIRKCKCFLSPGLIT